jgi:hypothetical protein
MLINIAHPRGYAGGTIQSVAHAAQGQVYGESRVRAEVIIERICPSRVIPNAPRNTNIDRSYEDATCRARLDNADTGTPLNAYGRNNSGDAATFEAAINKGRSSPRR